MNNEIAIKINNVGKNFNIYDRPHHRILQLVCGQRKKYYTEFKALDGVSFEVKKGETVGIVGANGAGKSTLLQIVCGIMSQTEGSVEVSGRVAALLELGAGFNPEFTGRENIYMSGTILGLSKKEIEESIDAVIEFADIGLFIEQPVKTYSSGMFVRLAFAVNIMSNPEIMIVDEALAVGDARFQSKCFARLNKLKKAGTSILLVSHDSEQIVRHCDSAVFLKNGVVQEIGDPKKVINHYLEQSLSVDSTIDEDQLTEFKAKKRKLSKDIKSQFASRPGYNKDEHRWGNGSAEIMDFHVDVAGEGESKVLQYISNQKIRLSIDVLFYEKIPAATFAISITSQDGVTIFGVNSKNIIREKKFDSTSVGEGELVTACFDFDLGLATGDYLFSFSVSQDVNGQLVPLDRRYDSVLFSVMNPLVLRGYADMRASFEMLRHDEKAQ